jgi:hypothetical protein
MMDRDFPPTPTQWKLTVSALAIGGVVGLLLFGGALPGLHPNFSPHTYFTFEGRNYYWTQLVVPTPWLGSNRTLPVEGSFHNVSYWTWVTDWTVLGGAYLHGNATMVNGTVDVFSIGGSHFRSNWTDQYVSPGAAFVVRWDGGVVAYLLLLA